MFSISCVSRASAVAALALFACFAGASAQAKVLAKVNGAEITDQDVATATADLAPTIPEQLQGPQRQAYILTYLIDLKLVSTKAAADAAKDRGSANRIAFCSSSVAEESMGITQPRHADTMAGAAIRDNRTNPSLAAGHLPPR